LVTVVSVLVVVVAVVDVAVTTVSVTAVTEEVVISGQVLQMALQAAFALGSAHAAGSFSSGRQNRPSHTPLQNWSHECHRLSAIASPRATAQLKWHSVAYFAATGSTSRWLKSNGSRWQSCVEASPSSHAASQVHDVHNTGQSALSASPKCGSEHCQALCVLQVLGSGTPPHNFVVVLTVVVIVVVVVLMVVLLKVVVVEVNVEVVDVVVHTALHLNGQTLVRVTDVSGDVHNDLGYVSHLSGSALPLQVLQLEHIAGHIVRKRVITA
jgi:hypothetical protein